MSFHLEGHIKCLFIWRDIIMFLEEMLYEMVSLKDRCLLIGVFFL